MYTNKGRRINVSIDILILILVSINVFDLTLFASTFDGNGAFLIYMLALVFIYIRNVGFQLRSDISPKLKPMWWILAGVLISFIPAYRYYGQPFFYSPIVYRQFAAYLIYPILLSVRPTNAEIKRALYSFSFIYLVLLLGVSFIAPGWVVLSEGSDFIEEGDIVHRLPGDQFLVLAFIYAVDDFRNGTNKFKYGIISIFIFFTIFLLRSRTLLMTALSVILFGALFESRARRRFATEVIMVIFLVVFLFVAFTVVSGLYEETMFQLSDTDYNRVKGFKYFISGVNGWLSYIWGNGFISGHISSIVDDLHAEGIYYSDLGLVGFWYQFGIIPVLTILIYVFRGLSKNHSFLIRANALSILVCGFTISYFLTPRYSLWLCLFFYLFYSDAEYYEAMKQEEILKKAKMIRRYRSLI